MAGGSTGSRPGSAEVDPDLALILSSFAGDDQVRAMNSASLCLGRRMFAMLADGHSVLKLSVGRVAALVADGHGLPWTAGQTKPQREWVAIPPGAADWVTLAHEARRYVGPKSPT